jgi:SAM-dependent methyltransferase
MFLGRVKMEAQLGQFTSTPSSSSGCTINSREIWNREYRHAGTIPSSHRASPSTALTRHGAKHFVTNRNVLDLGCGNGRNSIFLAQLGLSGVAIDYSSEAIKLLRSNLSSNGASRKFTSVEADLRDYLPDNCYQFDFVLDAYCTCHFLDFDDYENTLQHIANSLKSGGTYIRLHIGDEDRYYRERTISKDKFGSVSYDDANEIFKRHYSASQLHDQLSTYFSKVQVEPIGFTDLVHGQPYERNIFLVVGSQI